MDRRELLEKLVSGPHHLGLVRPALLALPYDCDDTLVVLERSHICNALQLYLSGEVSAAEIEDWAELLEGRPGIDYESIDEDNDSAADSISDALFVLSTPAINSPLTPELARSMLKELGSAI